MNRECSKCSRRVRTLASILCANDTHLNEKIHLNSRKRIPKTAMKAYPIYGNVREFKFFHVFLPPTLVDGFSKLWLRGKGNLGVETLISASSVPRTWKRGAILSALFAESCVRWQRYARQSVHAAAIEHSIAAYWPAPIE